MAEGKVPANGIDVWFESFGNPSDPAVLLVMGGNAQATLWRPAFFEPLVVAGYRVVRFDNRDIGYSTWVDFGKQPYTIETLAADALALMDALEIERAHLIGASMGGMISQRIAIDAPARVRSLTSIMSSPSGPDDPELPGMSEELEAVIARTMSGGFADPMEAQLATWRLLCGSRCGFDEAWWRREVQSWFDRAWNPHCAHGMAVAASPSRREGLARVTAPTLVIHGDEDPILPLAHGEATAAAIPEARLVVLQGIGHEIPEGALDEFLQPILGHLEAADAF